MTDTGDHSPNYPTLDQWEHAGIITIPLPASGSQAAYSVDLKLPDLSAFIAAGRIPNPLLAMAIRIEQEGLAEDALTPEEIADYLELQCVVIALNLRQPNLVEELGEAAAIDWIRTTMPPLHRRKIWEAAMHLDVPEAVRGLLDLARFRDELAGADLLADGGAKRKGAKRGRRDHLRVLRPQFRRGADSA